MKLQRRGAGDVIEPDHVTFEMSDATGALSIICDDGTTLVLRDPRATINALVEFFLTCESAKDQRRLEADRAAGHRYMRPGEDIDITIALPADVTRDEARQLGEQLFGGRGVAVQLEVPAEVRTVDDFFGEKMARSIAEQAWNAMSFRCPVCGEETAFTHEH